MRSTRVFLLAAAAALILGMATATQTYLSMLSHGHSFVRLVAWQVGSWSYWAFAAPWVIKLAERSRLSVLASLGVLLTAVHLPLKAVITVALHPFTPVAEYTFGEALMVSLPYVVMSDPVVYLLLVVGGRAIASTRHANELRVRESHLEAELSRAQLDALRLEIEPHFLFNTLNSVSALIRTNDNPAALSMLVKLGDLMRTTLDRSAGQFSTMADEVAVVMRYIDLQRARFGDRLHVTVEVARSCESMLIPSFLLQPLVENALRHGLANVRQGRVEIGASTEGDRLRVWVADDGHGVPATFDVASQAGIGLRNVRRRLTVIYGTEATLAVTRNASGGTTAELLLPAAGARVAVPA